MVQYRVYYAIEQFSLALNGSAPSTAIALHGLQSVGITTTFNLEQVFELGQLAIYENIEGIPDIEVSCEKVLDGYPLVYLMATRGAAGTSLANRQNEKTTGVLNIWPDTVDSAVPGTPPNTECVMSGLYVSSLSYTFPVEGNSTESCTLVGNNKYWAGGAYQIAKGLPAKTAAIGQFAGNDDIPDGDFANAIKRVSRRQDVEFEASVGVDITAAGNLSNVVGGPDDVCKLANVTILPTDVDGISNVSPRGVNLKYAGTNNYKAHIQSISVSTDLGREALYELGRKGAYYRYVTFPVEVTTEITCLAASGDMVDAMKEETNLQHQRIQVVTDEGTRIYAGDKNKLASVGMTGGDAGGDNMEITYTYTNFNDMDVDHMHTSINTTDFEAGGAFI